MLPLKTATPAICTIVAKNYLAQARTLVESVRQFHPDLTVYVLLVDDFVGSLDPATEAFTVVTPAELAGLPAFREFAFKYDVVELSTALKPFLLDWLFVVKGHDKVLYLDPDISVYAPLDPLFAALDGADLLVTPHLDRDFPEDGLWPDDSVVLVNGIYNLGFLGLRAGAGTADFLAWFKNKLLDKCVKDYARGYYVDQRFIDLAVGLFPGVRIERHPGCNVAFWNLHSRQLARDESTEAWRCNGQELIFFHFSSFDPGRPGTLARNCSRHTFERHPELRPLYEDYAARVLRNGFQETRGLPYTYGFFANGRPIPYGIRWRYRQVVAQPGGAGEEDPFASARWQRLGRLWEIKDTLQQRRRSLFRSRAITRKST